MEFEKYRSAWQRTAAAHGCGGLRMSRPVQLARSAALRDMQRSDELSRLVISLLFALLLFLASMKVMIPGPGRIIGALFAIVLAADVAVGLVLLTRRFRESASGTMRDFLSHEHRRAETRVRFERYSQALMFLLALVAVLLLAVGPRPVTNRDAALDAVGIMAVVTAFLAVAWRRAKSHSREIARDLERHLSDLEA